MKQACRDELVVYLFFSSTIYTSLYFYVLSTVLRKLKSHFIYIYEIVIRPDLKLRSRSLLAKDNFSEFLLLDHS